MKAIKFLLLSLIVSVGMSSVAQDFSRTKVMSRIEANNDFSYYQFPVTSLDVINNDQDSLVYEVYVNKHTPTAFQWYVEIDTTAALGNDSINVDIVWQYKVFDDDAWTTVSTTAWDGDSSGDLTSAIRDSTKLGSTTLITNEIEFARRHRLFIKPTTGAGVGANDAALVSKVYAKLHVLK